MIFTVKGEKMAANSSPQPQFMTSPANKNHSNQPLIDDIEYDQIVVPDVSFLSIFFLTRTVFCVLFCFFLFCLMLI